MQRSLQEKICLGMGTFGLAAVVYIGSLAVKYSQDYSNFINKPIAKQYIDTQHHAQSSIDTVNYLYHSWDDKQERERASDQDSINAIQKAQAAYAIAEKEMETLETDPDVVAYITQTRAHQDKAGFNGFLAGISFLAMSSGYCNYYLARRSRKKTQNAPQATPISA